MTDSLIVGIIVFTLATFLGYELIHRVNSLRKETGLALTDRIALTIPRVDADLLAHAEWIKAETLATSVEANGGDAPTIVRAG